MAGEKLTQDEIDLLLKQYGLEDEKDNWRNDPSKYDVIKYHRLICRYCHKVITTENMGVNMILSKDKCRVSKNGCMYVSKAWLLDKKDNNNFGWMRKYSLIEAPLEKKVMKRIDENKKVHEKTTEKEGCLLS